MRIEIIRQPIKKEQVVELARELYGEMAKGVVDLDRKVIALGGEMHADAEAMLLEDGSKQEHLWGFNVYPAKPREEWLEYTSLINIRPAAGNRTMVIGEEKVRTAVAGIVNHLIGG